MNKSTLQALRQFDDLINGIEASLKRSWLGSTDIVLHLHIAVGQDTAGISTLVKQTVHKVGEPEK